MQGHRGLREGSEGSEKCDKRWVYFVVFIQLKGYENTKKAA